MKCGQQEQTSELCNEVCDSRLRVMVEVFGDVTLTAADCVL